MFMALPPRMQQSEWVSKILRRRCYGRVMFQMVIWLAVTAEVGFDHNPIHF